MSNSYPKNFQGYSQNYYSSAYSSESQIKYTSVILGSIILICCICSYYTINNSQNTCVEKDSVIILIATELLKYIIIYVSYSTIIGVVLLILNIVPTPLMIFVKLYFGIIYSVISIVFVSYM